MHNTPHTEESKQKMRDSHAGRRHSPQSEFKKGAAPWNKGKHYRLTEAHRKNISNGLKGNKYASGHLHTESWKTAARARMTGNNHAVGMPSNGGSFKKGDRTGATNINWKGGISPEHEKIRKSPEYKQWRLSVFQRDRFRCVECGLKPKKLVADHIKPFFFFTELRLDVSNGRTFCQACDKAFGFNYARDKHTYGRPSNTQLPA